jgi:mannose-6-phosphate isomerase-like protein (cupin superfamily)
MLRRMLNSTRTLLSKDEGVADLWWPFGPVTGRYTIKATGAQTHGDLVQLLIRDCAGAATPLHVHHDTDETFYVIEGALTVVIGDERFEARAGDFVLAPRGVPHAWVVTSDTVEMLVTCGPAGREGDGGHGIDGFFREVADPVADGERPAPRMPDPELFAARMAHYGIELVGPPPAP